MTVIPSCTKAQNNIIAISSCIKLNWVDIECNIKESLKFKYWDIIYKNLILLLLYSFLYLNFNNICHKNYNG